MRFRFWGKLSYQIDDSNEDSPGSDMETAATTKGLTIGPVHFEIHFERTVRNDSSSVFVFIQCLRPLLIEVVL